MTADVLRLRVRPLALTLLSVTLLIVVGIILLAAIATVALAQDSTVDQVVTDLCANKGALLHWGWVVLAGTPAAASVLAAGRKYLPAPVGQLLYALSLNWLKDLAESAAAPPPAPIAQPQAPVSPPNKGS